MRYVLLAVLVLFPTIALAAKGDTSGSPQGASVGGSESLRDKLEARQVKLQEKDQRIKKGLDRAIERFCIAQSNSSEYRICIMDTYEKVK